MNSDQLIIALILATFAAAIGFGIYQWRRAKKAKQEHHHSVSERADQPHTRAGSQGAPLPRNGPARGADTAPIKR
jgi:hypothetical protein